MKCPDVKLAYIASARVGAAIYYLVGDEGPPAPTYPTAISTYSALGDTWTSAVKAPTSGAQRVVANNQYTYAGAAAVGTRIYLVGSAVPAQPATPMQPTTPAKYGVSEAYESFTDSWTSVTSAPFSGTAGTVVTARGNCVYSVQAKFPGLTALHVYDAATDIWTSRALPPFAGFAF
jgi:hypothetical protein